MSRATFGPKVLLTFLIWMIDIVCYLFICCLRVAAAWQLLLLLLDLAALAWHGCCLAWLLCRLRGAQLTNIQKYCKNPQKTLDSLLLLPYKRRQAVAFRDLPLRSIPALRATHSHGHGRPWVLEGSCLPSLRSIPMCHIRNKIGLSRTFLSSSHTSGNHHPARGAKNRAKIAFGAEKPSQKQKMRQKFHRGIL